MIKIKTTYITDDGKVFDNEEDAIKHQKELDTLDYKKLYYEALEKISDLETKLKYADWYPTAVRNPFDHPYPKVPNQLPYINTVNDVIKPSYEKTSVGDILLKYKNDLVKCLVLNIEDKDDKK